MSRYAQAAAIVPEPCRVFGTMLRPFCLGHHLLFKRLELPFAGAPLAECSSEEVMIGIFICGQTYEDVLQLFHTGEFNLEFERWKKLLMGRRGLLGRKNRMTAAQLEDGEDLFTAYLQDGYQRAPVWKHEAKDGIALSMPWELALKNRLVMAGYPEAAVLNGYMPGRWYDYYAVCELSAAANCSDAKHWRKMFFTKEDFEQMNPEAKEGAC